MPNYPDPGDDEREAMRMQSEKAPAWKMWIGLGMAIGVPTLMVVAARLWMPS